MARRRDRSRGDAGTTFEEPSFRDVFESPSESTGVCEADLARAELPLRAHESLRPAKPPSTPFFDRRGPELADCLAKHLRRLEDAIARTLQRAQKEGELAADKKPRPLARRS